MAAEPLLKMVSASSLETSATSLVKAPMSISFFSWVAA